MSSLSQEPQRKNRFTITVQFFRVCECVRVHYTHLNSVRFHTVQSTRKYLGRPYYLGQLYHKIPCRYQYLFQCRNPPRVRAHTVDNSAPVGSGFIRGPYRTFSLQSLSGSSCNVRIALENPWHTKQYCIQSTGIPTRLRISIGNHVKYTNIVSSRTHLNMTITFSASLSRARRGA